MRTPLLSDFYDSRKIVYSFLSPTPLFFNRRMSEELDSEIFIKHENFQPVGAFKVRGGLVRISNLSQKDKTLGVVTASTGNHGQSIAYAAGKFGVQATVFVPRGNNPDKNQAIKNLGANIIEAGKDFDEARQACEEKAAKDGSVYIHSANEPDLLKGIGTSALEIIEALPDMDIFINPIGGGSSCSANALALKQINPAIKVYGVQAEQAPAVYNSYKSGKMIETDSANTFAEGLATRVPFIYTFSIIQKWIDDIFLVSEEDMEKAIVKIFDTTHTVAEGAGASAIAAVYNNPELVRGKKVVLFLSGGNITREKLAEIFSKYK